ncbi:hypothetical protein PHISP_06984 [Aspergillus sp. HF37]|nr:hypothetical protein PHISP_06984 [Aspergillus sp. HF37]
MRVSIAALTALAATAIATGAADDVITETVTDYTTYCPSSSAHPTQVPVSSGSASYSMSTPVITSTVTRCTKWYASSVFMFI